MNRTVREESGAWSLLKKAAVRAKPTAKSRADIGWPRFVSAVGAPGVSNMARIFPARSTTATTMGAFTEVTAFCTMAVTSATLSWIAPDGGGSGELGGDEDPLPPQERPRKSAAQTNRASPESPARFRFLVVFMIQACERLPGFLIIARRPLCRGAGQSQAALATGAKVVIRLSPNPVPVLRSEVSCGDERRWTWRERLCL